MPNIGAPELLIVLLVLVVIFGSAKLPQLARSLGKSARILKAETKGLREDDDGDDDKGSRSDRSDRAEASGKADGSADARDRAAQLREEAARLEREAAGERPRSREQGALGSGQPIEGVPVSDHPTRERS